MQALGNDAVLDRGPTKWARPTGQVFVDAPRGGYMIHHDVIARNAQAVFGEALSIPGGLLAVTRSKTKVLDDDVVTIDEVYLPVPIDIILQHEVSQRRARPEEGVTSSLVLVKSHSYVRPALRRPPLVLLDASDLPVARHERLLHA